MPIVQLVPIWQGFNADDIYPIRDNNVYDNPVAIGTGSLSDDSDATGVQIGAWSADFGETYHEETVSVDFKLADPSLVASALLLQMRAKHDPDVIAAPPVTYPRFIEWVLRPANYTDHAQWIDRKSRSGSEIPAIAPLFAPESTPVTTPTWFAWYEYGTTDTADPTSPGWLQIGPPDPMEEFYTGIHQALTTDGLRVTFTWFWQGEEPYSIRRAWLDVYEFRLLVAVEGGAPSPYVPPSLAHPSLRMLQRGGSGGMAGIPRMVGNPTVRGSLRRGPGSVL